MMYWLNDTASSEIYTKHINTLCGQNVAVHIVTTGLYGVKASGLQVLEYVVQWWMGGGRGGIYIPEMRICPQ
jgi:hypothetical protein